MTRDVARCVCGGWGLTAEESLCRPCRRAAVDVHGGRLAALLARITYDHRGVRLHWSGPGSSPEAITPRVRLSAPDVGDPHGAAIELRWFEYWVDDQLIAACAHGASDGEVLALAVAQAHYALATLLVHEVGEWFTYCGRQVFPPHRPDPHFPLDEDNGPDGNGAVVLWLTYPRARAAATVVGVVEVQPAHGRGGSPAAERDPLANSGTAPGAGKAPLLRRAPAPCPVAEPTVGPASRAGSGPVPGQAAAPARPAAAPPVARADVGTLPGQSLTLGPHAVTVTAPEGTIVSGAWSPPGGRQETEHEAVEWALHDIHRVMVLSELCGLAAHLNLDGVPVLAPEPGRGMPGVPWEVRLTYDG
ncbi:hypothetical protein [Streptomyces aureoversilis]|uniref:Uncharacterized protein n=1 Tax=Streptomyces aureoversilis TaxID=67277 RepID=A0ABW0A7N4_9ACTN